MRLRLTFFIIIAFCSCGQNNEQTPTVPNVISVDSIKASDSSKTTVQTEKKTFESTVIDWEKREDSLRTEILKRKDNKTLKQSFLQEMYIRNVISVSKGNLHVTIPFNLHGPDCGAPDCYSTDVSFSFKLGDSLMFPDSLTIKEHEHGCIDKEIKLTGSFQLMEQTDKLIIYHSVKYKRTLVLFSSYKANGTTAYYFTNISQNKITAKNVNSIMKDYNEDDKTAIYPFTSWVLTTNEYENFLQ